MSFRKACNTHRSQTVFSLSFSLWHMPLDLAKHLLHSVTILNISQTFLVICCSLCPFYILVFFKVPCCGREWELSLLFLTLFFCLCVVFFLGKNIVLFFLLLYLYGLKIYPGIYSIQLAVQGVERRSLGGHSGPAVHHDAVNILRTAGRTRQPKPRWQQLQHFLIAFPWKTEE